MNRTKIEWTDFTWNPVTGCWGPGGTAEKPNRCAYCYAHKLAARFWVQQYGTSYTEPFEPVFHEMRLLEPLKIKKPAKIFVSSMGDLFGDWVPREWIEAVLDAVTACPQHTFQFLTKNSRRLKDFNPWPENAWVGATATDEESFAEAAAALVQVEAKVRFISAEPLLGEIRHFTIQTTLIDWLIIGTLTGPAAKPPCQEWVQQLSDWAKYMGIPRFLKNNLNWPERIQEFPS